MSLGDQQRYWRKISPEATLASQRHRLIWEHDPMTTAKLLETQLTSTNANPTFSEAVLTLSDGTRLCFHHSVDQRWAKAVGPDDDEAAAGVATELIEQIDGFRLNAKHLDIQFRDGSRCDRPLPHGPRD